MGLLGCLGGRLVSVVVYGQELFIVGADGVAVEERLRHFHGFFDLVFESFLPSALPEHDR